MSNRRRYKRLGEAQKEAFNLQLDYIKMRDAKPLTIHTLADTSGT